MFDKARGRFGLRAIHPGHTLDDIIEHTGFQFDCPEHVPTSAAPPADILNLMRTRIAALLSDPYPQFTAEVFARAS
jgi:glutaconate CoA-transferase subunit B